MTTIAVAQALKQARASGVDRLDAQVILAHVIQKTRTWLLAHADELLSAEQSCQFQAALTRLSNGEPLAYLLGEKEFYGLALHITSDVLVPRPDTESLVDWTLEILCKLQTQVESPRVIDLGTGSGAIALAIKHRHRTAEVTALDSSNAALAVAHNNAQRLHLDIAFIQSHWWQAVPNRRFHLAVSNPPYIAAADSHLPALRHEPLVALSSGRDGLDAIREIISNASHHLEPGAWLLVEHGFDQATNVRDLMQKSGFISIATRHDIAGLPRCTGGQWQ